MRHSFIPFLLIALFGGFAHLSAQQYDEHDKEQLRKFLRQEKNFEVAGLTESDTVTWLSSERWINKTYISGVASWLQTGIGKRYISGINLFRDSNAPTYQGNLHLDACQYLSLIDISDSKLEEVTISNCASLTQFDMEHPPFINTINFSNCQRLTSLFLSSNTLKNINTINTPNITSIALLYNANIAPLDLSKYSKLESLNVSYSKVSDFDFSDAPNLKKLTIIKNDVQNIDVSDCQNLEYLRIEQTKLNTIDLSRNTKLYSVSISNSNLEILDLSNNINLRDISCSENINLYDLNLSKNNNLESISIQKSPLSNINIPQSEKLAKISLIENQLEEIDISNCPNLEYVEINKNKLTRLDLSNNANLLFLNATANNLSNIDISNNSELGLVLLSKNKLEKIDLSYNNNLYGAELDENNLKEILISPNTKISDLGCTYNRLNFNALLEISKRLTGNTYWEYSKQAEIPIEKSYKPNTTIDLEFAGGTNYAWKDSKGKTLVKREDYSIENGVTTFLKEQTDSVYCEITNPDSPALTLTTTNTKVTNSGQSIESSTLEEAVKAYSVRANELTLIAPLDARYTAYNLSGDVVARGTVSETEETIDTPSGIILIKVETNEGIVNRKVIVK